jgi:peptide/nickel transport system permease protein
LKLQRFLLQRFLSLVIVLLGASLVIFAIMRFLPGDPVLAMMGLDTDPRVLAEARAELGLDQPVLVQYVVWLGAAFTGDFGQSIIMRRAVSDLLLARFPMTLTLAVASLVVALAIAIPAGVISARWRGRAVDHVSRTLGLAGVSMPNFWLGLLLIMVFGVQLRWFPVGGYVSPMQDPGQAFMHIVLPAITLGTAYAATIMRMLRASMLDVLRRDYIAVAHAYGMKGRVIVWNDAFRNALIPTLTVTGFAFGYMLAGTIIVEVIFNMPGVGRLLYEAILTRDYAVVQGVVLFNITLFVIVNFAVDVLYAVIDPRIQV